MNGQVYESRIITVSFATLRGTSELVVDQEWKTVPTPQREKSIKFNNIGKDKKLDQSQKRSDAKKLTWDHWTGPCK